MRQVSHVFKEPLTLLSQNTALISTSVQEDSFEVSEDTVEMDELNRHECMSKMTALLKHMVQNKISPEPQKVRA